MNNAPASLSSLPPEQAAIRAKCYHPSGTFVEFPKEDVEKSIPERFEKIVEQYPDQIAIKTADQTVAYAELNAMANRLAHMLVIERGTKAEPIALLFQKHVPLVAAMLGVLKARKFFVLLDPTFPKARIATVLEDCDARVVVTDQQNAFLADEISDSAPRSIVFESVDSLLSAKDLQLQVSPAAFAYLVYTSGSTGQPKGVIQTHQNLLHRIRVRTNTKHICAADRIAQLTSATSNAVTNSFLALLNGTVLVSFNVKKEGVTGLANWLSTERISFCRIGSPLFRRLCENLTGQEQFYDLRVIEITSDTSHKSDINFYKNYFPSETILSSVLSSTETGLLTEYLMDHDSEIVGDEVPVGYPAEDKQIVLLDDTGNEAGLNEVGEIVVKSKYLSPGYWKQPDLTKAKFVPDPAGGEQSLYFTGDLGLMRPDGCLIHKGRKDFRVKIRGYGVDVKEIEQALRRHPGIKHTVVAPQKKETAESYLVAYVVCCAGTSLTVSELRNFISRNLPAYMMPGTFVFLDSFPLTSNGKIDRRALPIPGKSRPELETPFVAPSTPMEKQLTELWADVLSLDKVGRHDNFFDLGGHSLAATRVISRVIKKFQLEIPLQCLFQSPTVADMANVIRVHQAKRLSEEERDRVLTELESLSDEQAEQLLSGQTKTTNARD
jgi:amino acid adenylation domain-containing protein